LGEAGKNALLRKQLAGVQKKHTWRGLSVMRVWQK
jgi:hypothetical protein